MAKERTITFIVTKDCQLVCKYCYLVGKNPNEKMTLDVAKKAVDKILENSYFFNEERVVWDFIGGEPLLEIDLITNIVDYIEMRLEALSHHWKNNYGIRITTNGLLYKSQKVQNFISKYQNILNLSISIDGTKRKQDLNRVFPNGKGSCKKLLMTKKKLPVRFTGQHFTIDKVLIKDAIRQANISNQDTVLDIGAGKGFLTVHLLKIANNVVAIENDTALVEHLRKLFSDARNVQVVGCDFRNFAVPKFPFKVVSNIPYGITSDIFKILMFESLGNFLGGSIVLQLEPTQKLFSRKLYNPYTVFYHTFFDLKLVYEVGPESFLPPPTVKSALLNIKRKHLFFDFKFKAKYLAFISCLLKKPDLSVKTALKSIFRKSQVRSISEKFGLNLNAQIVCLSPSQWLNCFLEMLEVVPEKFHPS